MIFSTVLDGLSGIPLPIRFQDGPVNAYLAEGDPLTLIDCGTRTDATYEALVKALSDKGYRLSDIQRLVITHHHTDHLGLAERIVAESGAEVWAHPLTVRWLATPDAAREHLDAFTDVLFRENGVPANVIETLKAVNRYLVGLTGTTSVTKTIDEGDTIELAGRRWQVYHTPGHAPDLICLYQPKTRVLIASDHLLRDISSNPLIQAPLHPGEPRPKPLLDYLREMQRIAELDIEIAYGGHGEPFSNVRELVDSRIAFHNQRAEKLLNLFDGQPRTLYELSLLMFPKVEDARKFLSISEVLGHLDLLEQMGRIHCEWQNGVVYWSRFP